ncbi:unnamed protein product [Symbiodinium pilosum]|uniref:Uncharacterized protein n=1 Tax=Symbiodinium pilosum TaxID=2952 RepID=A0A812SUR5_SYMPI|nr:unnamed protein product [Symbiodinium pilosum]
MAAFDLSFTAMLVHEMDATFRHEWRILPLLNLISDDDLARDVFILLHIPLCWLLLSATRGSSMARALFSIFSIIHVGLHCLLRNHPKYEFNNPVSWFIILLSGVAGFVHLMVSWSGPSATPPKASGKEA